MAKKQNVTDPENKIRVLRWNLQFQLKEMARNIMPGIHFVEDVRMKELEGKEKMYDKIIAELRQETVKAVMAGEVKP